MDRIKMSAVELTLLSCKIADLSEDCLKKFKSEELPGISLPKFKLSIPDGWDTWVYDYNLDTLELTVKIIEVDTNKTATFTTSSLKLFWSQTWIPKMSWHKDSNISLMFRYNKLVTNDELMDKAFKHDSYKWFYAVNAFVMIQKALLILPTVWVKESVAIKPKHKSVGTSTSTKHIVKLQNVYTIKSDLDIKSIRPEFKHYSTYKCECWGVRGHIRHLKDGREVFVKAYTKGAKRDNSSSFVDKDYTF